MAKQRAPQVDGLRREDVRTPDEVAAMLRLHALGWGTRRIAAEFGCSRNTVKRYVGRGGWAPLAHGRAGHAPSTGWRTGSPSASGAIAATPTWCGRSSLAEHGIAVSLRTVERAVAHLRRELAAEARATVRFETPPGRQMQIDFGGASVVIGGEARPGLPVRRDPRLLAPRSSSARSGTSGRRRGSTGSRAPSATSAGCRPRSCSTTPGRWSRTTTRRPARWCFNERLHAFAALLGRAAAGLRALPGADQGQGRARGRLRQAQRHRRAELRELGGARGASRLVDARGGRPAHPRHDRRAADRALRARRGGGAAADRRPAAVPADARAAPAGCSRTAAVEVDTNAYSVPWRLIGERVQVTVADGWVRVFHAGDEVAAHPEAARPASAARRAGALPGRAPASGGRPASPDRRLRRCRAPSPSCCGRSPSTSTPSGEAGDDGRPRGARRDARPAAADRDPRPARQPARRGGAARADAARGARLHLRARGRAPRRAADRDGAEDRARSPSCATSTASTSRPSRRSTPSRSASSRPAASSPTARRCCSWGRPASARRTSPWRSAARRSAGYSVLFATGPALVAALAKAHAEGRLEERLTLLRQAASC